MKRFILGLVLASIGLVFMGCPSPVQDTPKSSAKSITAFSFASCSATGVITGTNIAVTVPFGTTVTSLTPTIVHSGVGISPASGTAQDFTDTVSYTVTAADGSTQAYVVMVAVTPASSNADLSALTVSSATLRPALSAATTNYTASVAAVEASIVVTAVMADTNASVGISPAQPSSLVVGPNVVTITVTAQNGATRTYVVTVHRAGYTSANIGNLMHVPAGTFQRDATTVNTSTVSAFRMSEKEITRAQYSAIMVTDPSSTGSSSGTDDPVQQTNWYHALVFCNTLSMQESLTPVYSISGSTDPADWGSVPTSSPSSWDAVTADWSANGYRLPTEMEWMWAAMGATNETTGYLKAFSGSTGSNAIGDYAWYGFYYDPQGSATSQNSIPAGTLAANELGLFDMSGNVWEWNWDWYGPYPTGNVTDYRGAASGSSRVSRGGSWSSWPDWCSISSRDSGYASPHALGNDMGFRVVRP